MQHSKHRALPRHLQFEGRTDKPATSMQFAARLAGFVLIAGGILSVALAVGICGYHFVGGLEWIDALVNASMILGGMGPVDQMKSVPGKLFTSFYALFSGLVFVMTFGLILSPIMHRVLHNFHADDEDLNG